MNHLGDLTLREKRVDLEVAPVASEVSVLRARDLLTPEEHDLPLEQRAPQILDDVDTRIAQIHAANLRADVWRHRPQLESLIR